AIDCVVLLYFNNDVGVRETQSISDGWAKHLSISSAGHFVRHLLVTSVAFRQCSHDSLVEAVDQSLADIWHKRNFANLARLKAHGCSGRNVQAISERSFPIKRESSVALGEVVMTADLNRSVAGICHFNKDGGSVSIQDNVAGC